MKGKPGFIYFLRAEETSLIKIGRTKKPINRINALRTASPAKLTLIGYIPEGQSSHTEGSIHIQFDHLRVRGEWFREDTELTLFIEKQLTGTESSGETSESGVVLQTVEDFAAVVRCYRVEAGLGQQQLAQVVGVSRKWIVDMERGKKRVELGLVLKVIRALGIPLGVLKPTPLSSEDRMTIAAEMSKL